MQKPVPVAEAWARKYPEQVVLAITQNEQERINLMAVGRTCIVLKETPMFLPGPDEHVLTHYFQRINHD